MAVMDEKRTHVRQLGSYQIENNFHRKISEKIDISATHSCAIHSRLSDDMSNFDPGTLRQLIDSIAIQLCGNQFNLVF